MKELELQVRLAGKPEDARVAELVEENRKLRQQLTSFMSKLESAQATLSTLLKAMKASAKDADELERSVDESQSPSASSASLRPPAHDAAASLQAQILPDTDRQIDTTAVNMDALVAANSSNLDESQTMVFWDTDDRVIHEPTYDHLLLDNDQISAMSPGNPMPAGHQIALFEKTSSNQDHTTELASLPGIWSHHYQMGPQVYQTAMRESRRQYGINTSNSLISDHITSVQRCLKKKWSQSSNNTISRYA